MRRSSLIFKALSFLFLCALTAGRVDAQAAYTATGPGTYLSLGAAASGFQQDYGHHYVGGGAIYLDANLYRRIGIEAEVRRLAAHTEEDVKQTTYLVGPKISARGHAVRPYVKLLAGRGTLNFPFHYAIGHYFVVAPAAGLDYHLRESRLTVRLLDFEYQLWPRFSYGELHPYGVSAGISFDLFRPSYRPRGIRLGHR